MINRMRWCSAYGCLTKYSPKDAGEKLSFHKFPLKKPELLKKWLQAICRENFTPTAASELCSRHFEDSAFVPDNPKRRRLKPDAVPTLFSFRPMPKHRKPPKIREYSTSSKMSNPIIKVAKVTIPTITSAHQKPPHDTSATENQATGIDLGAIQITILCDKTTQVPSDAEDTDAPSTRGRKPVSVLVRKAQVRAAAAKINRRDKKIKELEERIKFLQENGLQKAASDVIILELDTITSEISQATMMNMVPAVVMESRPPLPPFNIESATLKVRLAEDAWNSRDPKTVASAYSLDTKWRNRVEFVNGRQEVEAFLERKWNKELEYRLIKELWAFHGHRIAVRFAYEWRDDSGNWFRSYGNENWQFNDDGLMTNRLACINDLPIEEADRKYRWPLGRRPDDHPGLSELGL